MRRNGGITLGCPPISVDLSGKARIKRSEEESAEKVEISRAVKRQLSNCQQVTPNSKPASSIEARAHLFGAGHWPRYFTLSFSRSSITLICSVTKILSYNVLSQPGTSTQILFTPKSHKCHSNPLSIYHPVHRSPWFEVSDNEYSPHLLTKRHTHIGTMTTM